MDIVLNNPSMYDVLSQIREMIQLPQTVYWIGCSGFYYKDWIGTFYPSNIKEQKLLEYYSSFFNTVEIDSTFYEWPKKGTIISWATKTPKNFRFSFKLPKIITHDKKLFHVEKDVDKFLKLLSPIMQKNKLGVILVQLPPSMGINLEKLKDFLNIIPSGVRFAIEFRRQSWLVNETFELLRKYNIAYVIVDEPLLPPLIEITANFSYIRFHGKGKKIWYYYKYKNEELEKWVPRIRPLEKKVNEIYIYFNNHFRGYAPSNALTLKSLLGLGVRKKEGEQKSLFDYYS